MQLALIYPNIQQMPKIVISGAGIGGLLLAISLNNMGLECEVLEQAPGFEDGVGGFNY